MYDNLQQCGWYRYKPKKKKTRYKGCKKCLFRLCVYAALVRHTVQEEINVLTTENMLAYSGSSSEMDCDDYALSVTNHLRFETDSYPIKVDNCCTQTITGYQKDFVEGTIKSVVGKQVRGFGNKVSVITHQGTVRWDVYDDDGKVHAIIVPNTYYVPKCELRLLSPQHWAQELNDNYPSSDGTTCTTYQDRVVLKWNQQSTTKTLMIDSSMNNVATIWTIGNMKSFKSAAKLAHITQLVLNGEIGSPKRDVKETNSSEYVDQEYDDFESFRNIGNEQVVIGGSTSTKIKGVSAEDELLQWNVRFGHIPMSRLQSLASEGVLPVRLARCNVPVCAGCMYGKLTRQPWRTKKTPSQIGEKANLPGECVSVDQLYSTVPGLIAQIKGIPTRKRYHLATVFVDHLSDYTFVHFQTQGTSIETITAKREFERHASGAGITVKRYHADNGRFIDNLWTNDVKLKNQVMSLCGVNAHHQNGRVEKRIRDLQEMARTSLLHANTRWPDAINSHLWPYAIRKAAIDMNTVKKEEDDLSPQEIFTNSKVTFQPRHHHTFGCPMYVLDGRLQEGNSIDKWESRARLAIYLGSSLTHASSVGLALSLTTGLVSPTFHA
jgi:hypothetical protein